MALSFTSSNPTMIYSNYPENILGNSMGDHYTLEADIVANKTYTVFLYHWNYSSENRRIGVALKNVGASPLNVTYQGGGCLVGSTTTENINNCATLAQYVANGANGSSLLGINNLATNSCAFMTDNRANFNTQKCTVAKFKFVASQNAKLRIFHSTTGRTANEIFASSFTQDAATATDATQRICGSGVECEKNATINTATTSSFVLFEHKGNTNTLTGHANAGEYQNANTFLTKSLNTANCAYIWGNYEMTYTLNLTNARGKTLYLSPNNNPAKLLVRSSVSNTWEVKSYNGTAISIPLSTTSTSTTVKIVLPGGNAGNVQCAVG